MDQFGPTGKFSKKRVHLLRWTTFPGRTGWNFGWMDRAHSLLVLLTKTWIQYLESGITYLIYCLFLALVELITYRFQCLVYFLFQLHDIGRYYFLTYLLTWLFTMHVFKIWLRRTLNGFLLSGCPGCHLGEENKKLYWTLWVAVSVVKIKALSENLASRNRLLSVDFYSFPY